MNDLSAITDEFGDISAYQGAPDFWVAEPEKGLAFIDTLTQAERTVIGHSAGGREIVCLAYGEKEPLDTTTDNLISTLASGSGGLFAPAFFGTKRRHRPVVALQGALHGGELTGTVASLNLCRIIETGEDLRGRAWPELRELALATRIVVIPWLNIDGAARWPLTKPGNLPMDLSQRCTQGVAKDGTKYVYPQSKSVFPIPPEKTAFMGSYYNDNGANLQYDAFMLRRQPETEAWMRCYLSERPDGVVIWHCNAGSMVMSGGPGPGHWTEAARIGGAVRNRLLRGGYYVGRLSREAPSIEVGFSQSKACYYVSGATPITCELPTGLDSQPYTPDEMLDIGLTTIEEILFYAHHDGLRPYEYWDKVHVQLRKGGEW